MSDSFASSRDEAFHGFGGRHDYLDQHGQEFYNWLQQEDVGSGSLQGATEPTMPSRDRYLFPNGPSAAYYVQSSLVSSHGYGFLLSRNEISHWRMDSDRPDGWQAESGGAGLNYVVVTAPPARAIAQLTQITGRQHVPAAWAVGSLYDRLVKYPSDPTTQYEREVQSDIANFDRYRMRVDGYRIEGWAELPPPVLAHVISELKARGIHPLLYFRAFVGTDSTGTDDPADYQYAVSHGYVATRADGSPYIFISNFNSPAAQIDFTNPAAVAWWQGRIRAALNLGADGFMQDFGEQVLADMHFHDGETGLTMHNRLPILYDQATREVVNQYEREHPGRHILFYTRAGYTGTPGNAAYESANFPGDETTDWSRASGLASLTTDMLSRAIGGAYGYSTDIGGYFDIGPYQATTKELFLRWAQWAALSPLFRLHGSILAGTHAPWTFDAQTVQIYKRLISLHLAARPLIRRLWRTADRIGMPITRPLWLQFPHDPVAARQDQEWLLGPNVLVAPVVVQGATSRSVYFPSGCWRSPVSGTRYRGRTTHAVAAPLARLPYFFRCGTAPFRLGPSCKAARGRLHGAVLGPIHLGERRVRLRKTLRRFGTRGRRDMDFFCLRGGGIRVGYPSPRLMKKLSLKARSQVRGRAILVLTANRRYSIGGIRPGTALSVARRRRRIGKGFRVGLNTWYLLPGRRSSGILKVRHGIVQEVGIADRRLTSSRRSTRRFLMSFR
jgi:alpha-glucosidase (family GH31 glycosyl hydrolase)